MFNRHTLVLLLATGITAPAFAQATPGTSQPKQFCRLAIRVKDNAGGSGTGTISFIAMTYGQESKATPLVDSALAAESAKVDTLDSEPLVLNYLSSQGWEIVGYNSLAPGYFTYLLQRPAK